jgi:hypothetical protein
MAIEELQKLTAAYNAVFDKESNFKACGRDACRKLMSLMQKYTSANIGDMESGMINKDVLQDEYFRIIAT